MRGTAQDGQYKGGLPCTNIRCRCSGARDFPRAQLRLPCTWQTCKKATRQDAGSSSTPHSCDINSGVCRCWRRTVRVPRNCRAMFGRSDKYFRHNCSSPGASPCHSSYWIPAIWLEYVDAMPYRLLVHSARNLKLLKSSVNNVLRNTHTGMPCPAATELY